MFELFFSVMWLVPILVFAATIPRVVRHLKLIQKHSEDPEALAEAIRRAYGEEGGDADGVDRRLHAKAASLLETPVGMQNSSPFGVGNSRPPQLPTPFGEPETSRSTPLVVAAVAIAIAAVALQVI